MSPYICECINRFVLLELPQQNIQTGDLNNRNLFLIVLLTKIQDRGASKPTSGFSSQLADGGLLSMSGDSLSL